ncbi:RNA-directed DNA polymerase, eukaryota, reverse transcriptase zinc-binding domain protein [Tanacetum coccineum]
MKKVMVGKDGKPLMVARRVQFDANTPGVNEHGDLIGKMVIMEGDFNVLLSVDEKSTCPSYIDTGMRDFQDFVEAIKVSDVKSTGLQFTWNQKPKGKHGTLKMIDRIMANLDFYSSFVGSNAVLQPYRISDHSPAMLRIPMESTFNPRPFKFSKSQATRNCIDCVTTTNGVNVDGDQVPLAFIDRYSEFLGQQGVTSQLNFTDLFCNKLTSDVANYVVRDVSDQEIHEAMFVMGDNKAPGPDGYNVAFFKEAWEILATDVTKSMKEFFTNGVLLKELNHTILALIPKVTSPMKINDYRPISCCNVLYKCISRIISNRIKMSLADLVSLN